ncbi:MAG: hypothetical protein U9Q21_03530 [Candidatus Auribacterota bacterium]|nr:hypothetical protein [Candidatus Auribacterota bacterium]
MRKNYLKQCSTDALALYLFLITVGDYEGLSYYGDESIEKFLNFNTSSSINSCRKELLKNGLIAYLDGLYQVLDLAEEDNSASKFREVLKYGRNISGVSNAVSVGAVIDKMFGGE